MKRNLGRVLAAVCALALSAVCCAPALAQMAEVKEKPPMYSYVAFWNVPRPQWADMQKQYDSEEKLLDKALGAGTIVAYGEDLTLIHTAEGATHDSWFSAMSMAGLLNVLDQVYKTGTPTAPVLASATKHWDGIYVSRYYNWHSGSWKDAYTRVGSYKLKADAPDDALDTLSKHLFVPLLEKLLADGAIHEYEIDTEAIHTESPGTFYIDVIAASPEGLDKLNVAIRETMKANPLAGPAEGSMIDFTGHRDGLMRTAATYK